MNILTLKTLARYVTTPPTTSHGNNNNKYLELNRQKMQQNNSASHKPTDMHPNEQTIYARLNQTRRYNQSKYLTPQDQLRREESRSNKRDRSSMQHHQYLDQYSNDLENHTGYTSLKKLDTQRTKRPYHPEHNWKRY